MACFTWLGSSGGRPSGGSFGSGTSTGTGCRGRLQPGRCSTSDELFIGRAVIVRCRWRVAPRKGEVPIGGIPSVEPTGCLQMVKGALERTRGMTLNWPTGVARQVEHDNKKLSTIKVDTSNKYNYLARARGSGGIDGGIQRRQSERSSSSGTSASKPHISSSTSRRSSRSSPIRSNW